MFEIYGPIVKLKLPGLPPFVVTKDPSDIEAFFKGTMDNPIREGLQSLKMIRGKAKDNFFEDKAGILVEYVVMNNNHE